MLIGADALVPIDGSQARVVADPFWYCRRCVTIDVGGVSCAVHFDCEAAAGCFAQRYADLIVRNGDATRHAFALNDKTFGRLFWAGGSAVYRWPHGDLDASVIAFLADAVALTAFFQHRADGMVSLHAATVGLPGGVGAIIGDSNGGKTTTAVACLRRGMALYSDERCLVDPHSFVHAFPRALNVRAPGLHLLACDALPGADSIGAQLRARDPGDWNDVRISDLAPQQTRLEPQALRAVFLLAGTAAEPEVRGAAPRRAAQAAIRWTQGAGGGLDKVQRLMTLFSNVRCYRLWLGTPDASAELIRTTLEACIVHCAPTA